MVRKRRCVQLGSAAHATSRAPISGGRTRRGVEKCTIFRSCRIRTARLLDTTSKTTHAVPPPVDTLELVKRLERSGMSPQQAEETTKHMCEVVTGSLERVEAKFASKAEVEKANFLHDAAFGLFKAEIRTTLEVRHAAMTRDFDGVRAECDKLRAELKYEIDKIQASQRLDLNLEKGRIRDELLSQNQKAAQTENRLDKEMTNMKTTLEANKNDIVRFAVGAIASTTAIGLGILRLLI